MINDVINIATFGLKFMCLLIFVLFYFFFFFFQAEDGIRDIGVTGVQTCALPIFYAELLAQMDLRYFMSGVLMATAEDYACISVQRSARLGHVQKDEISLMQRLLPHVQQAFDVARRLNGASDVSKSFERAFDWIADGVAFVSAAGNVIYSNEALQAIVRRNDVVRLRKGAIDFLTVEARGRFDKALDAVRRLRPGEQAVLVLTDFPVRRAADAPPYLVSVRPLARPPRESQSTEIGRAHV